MIKGLKELKELKETCATHMGNMVYILQEDKFEIIEKELKAPINLINKELRNARKLLPYDNYRCGYIDALIIIKDKIKEQSNEK